jgi:hypothetical protein
MTKNGKNVQLKNWLKYFLGSKIAIYLYLGFYKVVQGTGEAFRPLRISNPDPDPLT